MASRPPLPKYKKPQDPQLDTVSPSPQPPVPPGTQFGYVSNTPIPFTQDDLAKLSAEDKPTVDETAKTVLSMVNPLAKYGLMAGTLGAAGANTALGALQRYTNNQPTTPQDVAIDAGAGAAGNLLGTGIGKLAARGGSQLMTVMHPAIQDAYKVAHEAVEAGGPFGIFRKANEKAKDVAAEKPAEMLVDKAKEALIPEETRPPGIMRSMFQNAGRTLPTEDVAQALEKSPIKNYLPLKMKVEQTAAKSALASDPKALEDRFLQQPRFDTPQDQAQAQELYKKLLQENRTDEATTLYENLAKAATNRGQQNALIKLLYNETPEGAVARAMRGLKRYNETNPKVPVKISPEDVQQIKDLVKVAQGASEGQPKEEAWALVHKKIASLTPASIPDMLRNYSYINLLLRPLTAIRNVTGNAVFGAVEQASKVPGALLDRAVSLRTGKRAMVMPDFKGLATGAVYGAKRGISDVQQGIDTSHGSTIFSQMRDKPFDTGFKPFDKTYNAADKGLRYMLGVPDRAAYEATKRASTNELLKATGLKELTPELQAQVDKEGLEAVFQDDNFLSKLARGEKQLLNKAIPGTGDAIIPMANVPASMGRRILDYNPTGLGKGAYQLGKVLARGSKATTIEQREAIRVLMRGLVGTGEVVAGAKLAENGLTSPSTDNSNIPLKQTETNQGLTPNGIKFGKNTVGLGELGPLGTPLVEGVAIEHALQDIRKRHKPWDQVLMSGVGTAVTNMLAQTYMQGLSKVGDVMSGSQTGTETAKNLEDLLTNTAGRLIPFSGLQQTAYNALNPNQKETSADSMPMRILRKTAPVMKVLEPDKMDQYGKKAETFNGHPFLNQVSPVSIRQIAQNPVYQASQQLLEMTGKANHILLPPKPNEETNQPDGRTGYVQLNNRQISDYMEKAGSAVYALHKQALADMVNYRINNPEIAQETLARIKDDVEAVYKAQLLGIHQTGGFSQTEALLQMNPQMYMQVVIPAYLMMQTAQHHVAPLKNQANYRKDQMILGRK